MKVRTVMIASGFLAVLLAAGCTSTGSAWPRFEYRGALMGVQARCLVHAPDEASARKAAVEAFDRMEALETILSDWRPDSELARLGQRAPHVDHPISADLARTLSLARRVAAASNGAFDVTVGPITHLWRKARQTGVPPDDEAIEAARDRVGWRRLHVDTNRLTARLDRTGLVLDCGGIGKGYAADEALRVFVAHGLPSALVEIGGDLALGDAPPGTEGWLIARLEHDEPLRLRRCGVATSGDRERGWPDDGLRLSHILDPRTGRPTLHGREITVIAPGAALADALASALSVAEPREWPRILEAFPGSRALHGP